MRSITILLILFIQFFTFQLSGQLNNLYKRGSLQLPNLEKMNGLIWMPQDHNDSTSFIFFRKNPYDYPLRYGAHEIVSFEIMDESRHYVSIMVPIGDTMVRRIAELHFDGEYKLFSTTKGREQTFYLIDRSGTITTLVNTYSLPAASNNFSVVYNYEYRSELASVFNDYPEAGSSVKDIKYNSKDLAKFLMRYHQNNDIQGVIYPLPRTTGFVGASGGFELLKNVNLIDDSQEFFSPMAFVRLSGEIASFAGPAFMQFGISYCQGRLYHDLMDETINYQIVYSEVNTSISLIKFNVNVGMNLFKAGNFTPYVSVGGESYLYSGYSSYLTQEIFRKDVNAVYTFISEDDDLPDKYPAIMLEIGTNYNTNSKVNFRSGVSYHHFFDRSKLLPILRTTF